MPTFLFRRHQYQRLDGALLPGHHHAQALLLSCPQTFFAQRRESVNVREEDILELSGDTRNT